MDVTKYIKEYKYDGELIALLVKREFQNRTPTRHAAFISSENQSLQLGIGYYPKDLRAPAHTHKKTILKVRYEELLHVIRGRMKVDLYNKNKTKFASFVMRPGDTVHLISGGHGFKMLSPCKCVEVKQGPYLGYNNKNIFEKS
jgi:hypothetical protein